MNGKDTYILETGNKNDDSTTINPNLHKKNTDSKTLYRHNYAFRHTNTVVYKIYSELICLFATFEPVSLRKYCLTGAFRKTLKE